ncbi:MAG: hypothetical protein KatS3mg052_0220 [Candidatus Roseilinea sp.]|nr:MAG: hypothetical protein KatS3mg052_0220 [Candidatus Roseilinea sp.]
MLDLLAYTSLPNSHSLMPTGSGLPPATRSAAHRPTVYQFVPRMSVPIRRESLTLPFMKATSAAASLDVPFGLTTHMPRMPVAFRKLMKSVGLDAHGAHDADTGPQGSTPG